MSNLEISENGSNATIPKSKKTYKWTKATDSRGNEIEGLWIRNRIYYYQMRLPNGGGARKVALFDERNERVRNVPDARKAIQALQDNKKEGCLPTSGRIPKFKDYVTHYLATITKDELTIKKEKGNLELWEEQIGDLRLNQIRVEHINTFVKNRLEGLIGKKGKVGAETANHDVVALSNLLNLARDENWLGKGSQLVTEIVKRQKVKKKKVDLVTHEQLDRIIAEALKKGEDGKPVYAQGEIFVDWLKFMACSGARRMSALAARWKDVDWKRRQLHLHAETKFDKHIIIPFNPHLEAHLLAMQAKRIPDSDYLFPARFKTKGKGHLCNMQKTIEAVRTAVGMPDFSPHDLRHQFISYCVMDGIDFMTIALWVGHSDGGILIGKVYGHLREGHSEQQAQKVTLGQAKVEEPKVDPQVAALQAQLKVQGEMMQQMLATMKDMAAK